VEEDKMMFLDIVIRVNVERVLLKDSGRYKTQVANIWQDMRQEDKSWRNSAQA
jgi:hypothetical protein